MPPARLVNSELFVAPATHARGLSKNSREQAHAGACRPGRLRRLLRRELS